MFDKKITRGQYIIARQKAYEAANAYLEAARNYITAGELALAKGMKADADQMGVESMNCSSKASGIYTALTIMDELFGIGK